MSVAVLLQAQAALKRFAYACARTLDALTCSIEALMASKDVRSSSADQNQEHRRSSQPCLALPCLPWHTPHTAPASSRPWPAGRWAILGESATEAWATVTRNSILGPGGTLHAQHVVVSDTGDGRWRCRHGRARVITTRPHAARLLGWPASCQGRCTVG